MYLTLNSMNNLLSYYGLVDARITASEKDLPVPKFLELTVDTFFFDKVEKLSRII